MKKLVIVAPTFNEQENIEAFITNTLAQSRLLPNFDLELVISDSHSKDATKKLVQKIQTKEPKLFFLETQLPGPGKLGAGIIDGLNYGLNVLKADFLMTIEADLTNDINKIPDMVAALSKADLVVGSRYAQGGGIVNWSLWRKFLSFFGNLFLRLASGNMKIHEYTNLYRVFKSSLWATMRPDLENYHDWLFVPAFMFEAIRHHIKIIEVPYVFYDRSGGSSKMNTPSYTKNLLKYALRYKLTSHGTLS